MEVNQVNLFDHAASVAAKERQASAMNAAYDHAADEFKVEYPKFILTWLKQIGPATAETIRHAYENSGKPQPGNSKRASGAIFQRLVREGKIHRTGFSLSVDYGNPLRIYEWIKD